MKYFNMLTFISYSNIYNSISAVAGMNEPLQLPTVKGNRLIHWCQAFTKK